MKRSEGLRGKSGKRGFLWLAAIGGGAFIVVYIWITLAGLHAIGTDVTFAGESEVVDGTISRPDYEAFLGFIENQSIFPCSVTPPNTHRACSRPIEEFVEAQGTFCYPDRLNPGVCQLYLPPAPNYFGWMQAEPERCGSVDYAGLANRWLIEASGGAIDLGTEVTGSVTEREFDDGLSMVHVRLQVTNALTFVVDGCALASGPLLFGNRVEDVLAGAEPALASAELDVTYVDYAFGSPMRDLVQVKDFPEWSWEAWAGQAIRSAAFRANAHGPLRAAWGVAEGTPGRASFNLAGLLFTKFRGATSDGSPVDRIDLNTVGQ